MVAAVPVVFWLRVGISPATIARKAGAPAVAKRTCVVVVSTEIVEIACEPPPITTALLVSDAAEVTQVGQERVLVESDSGELKVATKSEIAGCIEEGTPEVEIALIHWWDTGA